MTALEGEGEPKTSKAYAVAITVLVVALIAEGVSLMRALLQVRGQARTKGRSLRAQPRASQDPSLRTVLAEDSAAVLGVVLALAGVGRHISMGRPRHGAS